MFLTGRYTHDFDSSFHLNIASKRSKSIKKMSESPDCDHFQPYRIDFIISVIILRGNFKVKKKEMQ